MKKQSLDEIKKQAKIVDYRELYDYIMEGVENNQLRPVKKSGWNGLTPPLYNTYWIVEEKIDYSPYIDELQFKLHAAIKIDYYLKHLEEYVKEREYVLLLNTYLNHARKFEISMSQNERCFDIWQREKFLQEGIGKKICARCGISMEQLHFYETFEPFAYFTLDRKTPQNLLIIENKDTFFTMRRLLLEGQKSFWGIEISTLIYVGGKGIIKAFGSLEFTGEPYMVNPDNTFYYFGDLDYEGIQIFQTLATTYEHIKIIPFKQAYERMLQKAECYRGNLPKTKEGQNRNIGSQFMQFFAENDQKRMQSILENESYLPQECLNESDMER